ncbi:MAG: efflux RND transporter periplasmic adaptor subunit [Lutibacter sp.]|nr:efflux RND transporter periplasmic adaptor subunit [Lutibacter sp.]MBP9599993.1 efflux RND transporter periplasmic adaptor subunit [Lutibacter sp.]
MKKVNKKIIAIAVVVIIVVLGVLAIVNAKRREAALPVAKKYDVVVATIKPTLKYVELQLPYLAQTENDKDVKLSSKVAARINFIKASGTKVTKGTIIAQLDNTSVQSSSVSLKSQINATKTSLKNLEETHQRTKELLAIKGASIEQFQTEQSAIEAAKAQLETLYQNKIDINNTFTYTTITSPVDGVISKTFVNTGDVCSPGHPIASISAVDGFYLLVRIPTDLTIYGVNFKGVNYPAISLNSTFNNLAEYKVYVDSKEFTTGDKLEVNVIVFKGEAIKLPFDAILNRNGENFVFIKENNTAKAVSVTILQTGEDGLVISNNELAGKEIVVAKQDILLKLLSGSSIKTQNN